MPAITTSEKILDQLASGKTFADLRSSNGYTRKDFLTAALFGVAELQNEYAELLRKYGKFKSFGSEEVLTKGLKKNNPT